jgi:hypothetical protein
MSAEQIKRLADEYAHCYAFVGDDTMPLKRAELHAAIDAHTANPPINAAPARQFDLRPDREIVAEQARKREPEQWAERAAPNEPVAPLPSAELSGQFRQSACGLASQDDETARSPTNTERRLASLRVLLRDDTKHWAPAVRDQALNVLDSALADIAEAEETTANLVHALRKEVDSPTFMGEPLLAERASPQAVPAAWVDPLDLKEGQPSFMACSHVYHTRETNLRCTVPLYAAPQAVDAPVAPADAERAIRGLDTVRVLIRDETKDWAPHVRNGCLLAVDAALSALKAPAKESDV